MVLALIVYLLGFCACAALLRSVKLAAVWPFPALVLLGVIVALSLDFGGDTA